VRRRYVTADVFTDRMFGGNPLAVVLDAEDLTTAEMQAIALEFNYSETTFVLPPEDPANTAKVRIFTPRTEIPFAGHPNVGTAFVLARESPFAAAPASSASASGTFLFEEIAGLVPLKLLREHGATVGAELCAPEPLSQRTIVSREIAAACLSLQPGDIAMHGHAPQVISVGLPFLAVEVGSRDALHRAKPGIAAHSELLPLDGADAVFAYWRALKRPCCMPAHFPRSTVSSKTPPREVRAPRPSRCSPPSKAALTPSLRGAFIRASTWAARVYCLDGPRRRMES
jgi:trans-2,3-dihydro-3-hydroxyanthranilate isomerase